MACVIAKNLISNRSGDRDYAKLWLKEFDAPFRQNMKDAVLSQLICPSSVVRTQIASLVSAIAKIEIPNGEWLNLVETLCNNVGNTNPQIKLTSLQTLGFICEELEPEHLNQDLKNLLISSLTSAIDKNEGNDFVFTRAAIKAFLHAVSFCKEIFNGEQQRNFIMLKVFEALEVPLD